MKHLFTSLFTVAIFFLANAQSGPVLLGMTESFGANNAGTIFQFDASDSTVATEFSFPANLTNAGPVGINLTQASNGKLYGLNAFDGATGSGTLFDYNVTTNNYNVLASFDSATGQYPLGALLQANNGVFYGLTSGGDSTGGGTLFSYTIGNSEITKLVTLASQALPQGSVIQAANGKLYGMTNGDGTDSSGTIFQYDIASGVYTTVFNFQLNSFPTGSLLEVGADTLYGLTNGSGLNSSGVLFRYIAGSNTDTILYNFPVSANPTSILVHATNGLLYGLTNADGVDSGGTIFSYDINTGVYTVLHNFRSNDTDGVFPNGGLMQASNGQLYGTTTFGGTDSDGTIFRYNITSGTYAEIFSLNATTGGNPGGGNLTEYYAAASGLSQTGKTIYNFSIYPNPASGLCVITNNYTGNLKAEVISMIGDKLMEFNLTSSHNQFDSNNMASGMYQILLTDDEHVVKVLKLVKE